MFICMYMCMCVYELRGGGKGRRIYATKIYTPPPINVYSV